MKTLKFNYCCAKCGMMFFAPGVSDFSYGEFVMNTDSGKSALLHAVSDSVYQEVCDIVSSLPEISQKSDTEKSEIIQSVFSVACDVSTDNEKYKIGLKPKCPSCGSHDMASWEIATPQGYIELEHVSHTYWNSLTSDDKKKLIGSFIIKNLPEGQV